MVKAWEWENGTTTLHVGGGPETICQEADRLTRADRRGAYGHPLDDMSKVAGACNALLGLSLTPEQVAIIMVVVKLSREVNQHGRDNLVDVCGWAKCAQEIHEERERRAQPITNDTPAAVNAPQRIVSEQQPEPTSRDLHYAARAARMDG